MRTKGTPKLSYPKSIRRVLREFPKPIDKAIFQDGENRRSRGLHVHVCKMETLQEAYQMAKKNNGAPGIDGVSFDAIEESGVEGFLKQIQDELVQQTYRPMAVRKKEIPKDGGT